MSKGGRYLNKGPQKPVNRSGDAGQKPRKRGGWKKVLLIILAVILLLIVIVGVGAVLYGKFLLSKRTKVETVRPTLPPVTQPIETEATEAVATEPVETEPTAPTEPDYGKSGKVVNILIVGQSSRAGEEAKLADTIMLATINKMTSTVTITSFLRDTYTQFPNPYTDVNGHTHSCGKNKINAAYALGWNWGGTADAMMFLDQTITNNFGIEIDGNVEVDFDAFEKAVDLVNGLPLELDADEAKYLNRYFTDLDEEERAVFVEGENHLDGWECLVYARMRHSSAGDNDYKRTNRQRTVIAGLLDKCTRRSIPQLNTMAQELMPYLTTDLSDSEIATLMLELIPLLPNLQMESVQMPAEGTMWSVEIEMDGVTQYPLAFDVGKNTEIMRAIAEADHM